MSTYQPGEVVDIAIKGARVGHPAANGFLNVFVDGVPHTIDLVDAVTVERRAPADWPPRPGDIWAGPANERWFAVRYYGDFDDPKDFEGCNSDGWRVVLMPMQIGPYGDSEKEPDDALRTRGPLTLVHREDEPDGEVSEP